MDKKSTMETIIEIYNDKIEQGRFEALMAISNYLHYEAKLSDKDIDRIFLLFND
jgi:hypothetical protein